MVKIHTFVFMDLESTGLPKYGNRVRATEVSLISVNRQNILNCNSKDCIPRVINKLSFVCNPRAMITDEAVIMSGLSNENLEDQSPFDQNKADLIEFFLQNCVPPICFVAHNGFYFDFPLLKKELAAFSKAVAPDVLCADSIPAFKFLNNNGNEAEFTPIIDRTDMMLFNEVSRVEEYISSQQTFNETTPVAQLINTSCSVRNLRNAKRKLFEDNDQSEENGRTKIKVNYSLAHIYISLFHKTICNAHRAETDAIALLQCCVKMGAPLLDYFDAQAKKFEDIVAMR